LACLLSKIAQIGLVLTRKKRGNAPKCFFITNTRDPHHRLPSRTCAIIYPDLPQPMCATPNQGHRSSMGQRSLTIESSVTKRRTAPKIPKIIEQTTKSLF